MDKKEAKEFSNNAIYGLSEMVTLIDSQTEDLNEYPDCPTEEIAFDGENDFYEK